MVKRAVVVAVAGISIYLVFPTITEVFASWPRLLTLDPLVVHPGGGGGDRALYLHVRAAAARPADQGLVPGHHVPAGRQLDHPDRAGRCGGGRRRAVPDAGRQRAGHQLDCGRTRGFLPPRCGRPAGPPGLRSARHPGGRAHQPGLGQRGHPRGGGVRGLRRAGRGGPGLRRTTALVWPHGAAAPELDPAETAPDDQPGRNAAHPAQRHPGGAGRAMVAGTAAIRWPPGLRLSVPAVRAAGHRGPPATLTDPHRLRGGRRRRA